MLLTNTRVVLMQKSKYILFIKFIWVIIGIITICSRKISYEHLANVLLTFLIMEFPFVLLYDKEIVFTLITIPSLTHNHPKLYPTCFQIGECMPHENT